MNLVITPVVQGATNFIKLLFDQLKTVATLWPDRKANLS